MEFSIDSCEIGTMQAESYWIRPLTTGAVRAASRPAGGPAICRAFCNRPALFPLNGMARGWWKKSVTVMLGAGNVTYVVNNTLMAARILLDEWPVEDGPAHLAARIACMAAMEGGDVEKAREAFEAAAKEAGIFVR
ncbi:MAG TPA: DUF982 domain-containing protein [Devosia sp.]|nr:DUF982 domain-containing protein [Devosia sp.]